MNKKGFTLVELLAVIALLGILMTISVPNIISTINNNKKDSFLIDSKRLVSRAEYLKSLNKEDRDKIMNGENVIYSFSDLNSTGDFDSDTDGGKYSNNTYIIVSFDNNTNTYKFCVYIEGSKRKIGEKASCLDSSNLDSIDVVKDIN